MNQISIYLVDDFDLIVINLIFINETPHVVMWISF